MTILSLLHTNYWLVQKKIKKTKKNLSICPKMEPDIDKVYITPIIYTKEKI